MKNIKVNLLHFTPSKVAIKAVSKPYSNSKSNLNLVNKVVTINKHESVAEHVTFNFEIVGISRLCLQELTRHRMSSFTVESTRFTLSSFLDNSYLNSVIYEKYFVIPENSNKYKNLLYLNYLNFSDTFYAMKTLYDNGQNIDYLKYFLPENFRTELVWSINMRSLFNFLKLRLDKSAHFEIRYLANLILTEITKTEYSDFFNYNKKGD